MAKKSKRQIRMETYGNNQETVPVLIPPTRYNALKALAYQKGSTVNKIVRDAIEAQYKEELDQIETAISFDQLSA